MAVKAAGRGKTVRIIGPKGNVLVVAAQDLDVILAAVPGCKVEG